MDTHPSTCKLIKFSSDNFNECVYRDEISAEIGVTKRITKFFDGPAGRIKFKETKPIEITYFLDTGKEDYCKLKIAKLSKEIESKRERGGKQTFTWSPINYSGHLEIMITVYDSKDQCCEKYTIPIWVESKFGDANFYEMMNYIRKKHIDIYSYFNPKIDEIERKKMSDIKEQFEVLKSDFKTFEGIFHQISLNPNKKLIKEYCREDISMANNVDYSSIYDIITLKCGLTKVQNENFAHQLQQKMSKNGNHYLPETILTHRNIHSFDVLENQMLKHFLTMIYTCCTALNKLIGSEIQNLDTESNQKKKSNYEDMQRQCADFKRHVVFMKNQPFLEDVQELKTFDYSSSVLRREMNYMRFYKIYKKFREHPIFDLSDVYRLSIKDMPTLYEYYCALVIASILLEYKDWSPKEHITKETEIGYSMQLNTGIESLIELSKDDKHIRFFYNKEYDKYSWSKVRPDFAIEMTTSSKMKILILDAKYRNKLKPESEDPESAINKMHVYKDSIRENGEHLVESAFVLYLGDTKIQSIDSEECTNECIGGIKILPKKNGVDGNIECLREEIKKFINAV